MKLRAQLEEPAVGVITVAKRNVQDIFGVGWEWGGVKNSFGSTLAGLVGSCSYENVLLSAVIARNMAICATAC